ncbi:hypothetical protein L195_g029106 [Trifolium pratense]|uniref:Uncharacterized protein n=1 Tax=Trifolium pratense TaxID=57577 RepID=A0A2K3L3T9_TRIPR|nr:hypothetical protein L195_g029106 [Trifolium pratense]
MPSTLVMVAVRCNQVAIEEDPLIENVTRAKEVTNKVFVEKFPSISTTVVHVELVQVEDARAKELDITQRVDWQHSPKLGIVGSWNDIGDFRHRMYTERKRMQKLLIIRRTVLNHVVVKEEPFYRGGV